MLETDYAEDDYDENIDVRRIFRPRKLARPLEKITEHRRETRKKSILVDSSTQPDEQELQEYKHSFHDSEDLIHLDSGLRSSRNNIPHFKSQENHVASKMLSKIHPNNEVKSQHRCTSLNQ